MIALRRALSILLFCIWSFSLGQALAGEVQCNCPTINAQGTGNSDCSASESSGVCTIDFNTFADADENLAIGLVSSALSSGGFRQEKISFMKLGYQTDFIYGLDKEAAKTLKNKIKNGLTDQLIVYAMVSVVQNETAQFDMKQLGAVFKKLREHPEEVSNAYIGNSGRFDSEGVLVTEGCIEIKAGDQLWAMFKSRYSPSIKSSQCQTDN
jgi:hypothetical protein